MRLRRSKVNGPGISRRGRGRGFSFYTPEGELITDPEVRRRILGLAIPPAWTQVWIAPQHNAHIQATGIDAAGRKQYVYHPHWHRQQGREKFDRARDLAGRLNAAHTTVNRLMRGSATDPETVLATAFELLRQGFLRVGNATYAKENGSYGLCTLECHHAKVIRQADQTRVLLEFTGKSGVPWSRIFTDENLVRVLSELAQREPRSPLLAVDYGHGLKGLTPADVNDFIGRITNGPFTAKDLRTVHGTLIVARSLANAAADGSVFASQTAQATAVHAAIAEAADALGNTVSVARKSYVDPRIIDRFHDHQVIRLGSQRQEIADLSRILRS